MALGLELCQSGKEALMILFGAEPRNEPEHSLGWRNIRLPSHRGTCSVIWSEINEIVTVLYYGHPSYVIPHIRMDFCGAMRTYYDAAWHDP